MVVVEPAVFVEQGRTPGRRGDIGEFGEQAVATILSGNELEWPAFPVRHQRRERDIPEERRLRQHRPGQRCAGRDARQGKEQAQTPGTSGDHTLSTTKRPGSDRPRTLRWYIASACAAGAANSPGLVALTR